jgi:hypothetical protein
MKKQTGRPFFHHRFYRYVRMMLRRYPKMHNEIYGLRSNNGVRSIIRAAGDTRSYDDRLRLAMFGEL